MAAVFAALLLGAGHGPVVGVAASAAALRQAAGGFQDTVLPQTGLTNPTAIQFASDGRVFVAQKNGRVVVYSDLGDASPTVVVDLRVNVYNFWDRGLLGMALDPAFPASPYLYVLYAYDAVEPTYPAPRWGGGLNDSCADPQGAGCVVTGRLSRFDVGTPAAWPLRERDEHVLVTDWFQQFPSHSVGALAFAADGSLYVSGGEGASFTFVDYGQVPASPSPNDPPGEGGSLRAQDVRSGGDPVNLGGAVLRLDPATGEGLPDNPFAGSGDANERRIVAYGLRNPLRFTFRPGTSELWVGDVGWETWEEVNRVVDPRAAATNLGWPCYEGDGVQSGYDGNNLPLCESLYAAGPGAVVRPYYTYDHGEQVVPGEGCPVGSSSISGLAFYPTSGGSYPDEYHGALFFADYSRKCLWAMRPGADGLPNPADIVTISAGNSGPVNLVSGPNGDIFYPGFDDGRLHRIEYFGANLPPTAVIHASPTNGVSPLVVAFDASSSTDPEGAPLTFAWDLDGDGAFDDGSTATAQRTYVGGGTVVVGLQVGDAEGLFDEATVAISVNNSAPVAVIDTPSAALTWKVGDPIVFSGHAADPDEPNGMLPAAALTWELFMRHCPSNCHTHPVQVFEAVAGGAFSAPDHEYPSHLELKLTATDSEGVESTASVFLQPRTVDLTFQTQPSGLSVAVNAVTLPTPFTRTVIIGSVSSLGAPSPQPQHGLPQHFVRWSDGGAQNHLYAAPAVATTITANFEVPPLSTEVCEDGVDNDGDGLVDEFCGATPSPLPGVPARLHGRVDHATVQLSWLPPIGGGSPAGYVLEAGPAPGAISLQLPIGHSTSFSAAHVPAGRYYARVRAVNASGAGAASNEVVMTVGCTARPGPPVLTSAVNGGLVSLRWSDVDGCDATTYRLLVGSRSGATDLGQIPIAEQSFAAAAPPGTYYVRVVAATALGASDPSNEVALSVGTGCAPPALPMVLDASRLGSVVELRWGPFADPAAVDADWPLSYLLEIGSAARTANLGAVPVGRTTVLRAAPPSGQFYVRVRPVDHCGAGQPSNDRVIAVP